MSKMIEIEQLKPLQDRVLVRVKSTPEKIGSIIVPDNAKKKTTRGEVIAVGPGKRSSKGIFIETTLKPGDRVVFGEYSGNEFEAPDRQTYRLMTEEEIYGVEDD